MFFLGATLKFSDTSEAAGVNNSIASARRIALTYDVESIDTAAGQIKIAGATTSVARDGAVSVLVVAAESRSDANQAATASALCAWWQSTGGAKPAPVPGGEQFIIVDSERRVALAGCDRFAINPLYYTFTPDGTLLVSSDLDALAAQRENSLDQQAIYNYLFFHCIPAPDTIYRDVRKLPPATMLIAKADAEPELVTYWQPDFAEYQSRQAPEMLIPDLRAAVTARVVQGSGAFLSGGLDSSTVAGLMIEQSSSAPTFTIGFDEDGYDERAYARVAADHFHADHNEYVVTPGDIADMWPQIAQAYGEPFGNSSVIPTYFCARHARRSGISTLLAGDGGDELFSGNERYLEQGVFERYAAIPGALRFIIEQTLKNAPALTRLTFFRKAASYVERAKMGLPDRLQAYNFLQRPEMENMFEPQWLKNIDQARPWALWRDRYASISTKSSLQSMLYLDWKFTLADNDLVKVGRMCELAGVSVSYPMLDDRVVNHAIGVAANDLVPGQELRGYYKRAMRGFLPEAILNKSKHGFGLPFGWWMNNDKSLRQLTHDAVLAFADRGIVRKQFCVEFLENKAREAPGYYGELIWIIVSLELWLSSRGY